MEGGSCKCEIGTRARLRAKKLQLLYLGYLAVYSVQSCEEKEVRSATDRSCNYDNSQWETRDEDDEGGGLFKTAQEMGDWEEGWCEGKRGEEAPSKP
jgi:hypothetical protein